MVTEPPGTNLTDDHRDPGCLGALITVVVISALPAPSGQSASRPRPTGQRKCGWRDANLRAYWMAIVASMGPSRVWRTDKGRDHEYTPRHRLRSGNRRHRGNGGRAAGGLSGTATHGHEA